MNGNVVLFSKCQAYSEKGNPSAPALHQELNLSTVRRVLWLQNQSTDWSSRKMGVLRHYDSFWTTFPKIKEKNINLRKNKNKKFIFFIGQEIKKPDLSGQNRSNPQNPDKTGQIRSNPEILPRTLF